MTGVSWCNWLFIGGVTLCGVMDENEKDEINLPHAPVLCHWGRTREEVRPDRAWSGGRPSCRSFSLGCWRDFCVKGYYLKWSIFFVHGTRSDEIGCICSYPSLSRPGWPWRGKRYSCPHVAVLGSMDGWEWRWMSCIVTIVLHGGLGWLPGIPLQMFWAPLSAVFGGPGQGFHKWDINMACEGAAVMRLRIVGVSKWKRASELDSW